MKLKMSNEVDLGREPVRHLLFVLAVPAITSQVVNALYNMVDRMYTRPHTRNRRRVTDRRRCMFPADHDRFCLCLASGNGRRSKGQYPDGKKDNQGRKKLWETVFPPW